MLARTPRKTRKKCTRTCSALACERPSRAAGLCQTHYKRHQRSVRPGGPKYQGAPGRVSDQGVVRKKSHLTQIEVKGQTHKVHYSEAGQAYVVMAGVLRAVDSDGALMEGFQIPAVVCSGCHHHWRRQCGPACKPTCVRDREPGWCDALSHPVFIGKTSST